MRLEAVAVARLRAGKDIERNLDSDSFTDSELAVGRMILPLLDDLAAAEKAIEQLSTHTRAREVVLRVHSTADDASRCHPKTSVTCSFTMLLALVTCAAFVLLAAGGEIAAVKELLSSSSRLSSHSPRQASRDKRKTPLVRAAC